MLQPPAKSRKFQRSTLVEVTLTQSDLPIWSRLHLPPSMICPTLPRFALPQPSFTFVLHFLFLVLLLGLEF